MLQSIENKVFFKILKHGEGWAFTKTDFVRESGEANIHQALSSLSKAGKIRRVHQGVYDHPRRGDVPGRHAEPDIRQVAHALARKFNWRIHPGDDTALYHLGLRVQAPERWVFVSDGPSREYDIGGQILIFRKAAMKDVGFKYEESGVVVQALKALGRRRVDQAAIKRIRQYLGSDAYGRTLKDTRSATGWVYRIIKQICKEEDG